LLGGINSSLRAPLLRGEGYSWLRLRKSRKKVLYLFEKLTSRELFLPGRIPWIE